MSSVIRTSLSCPRPILIYCLFSVLIIQNTFQVDQDQLTAPNHKLITFKNLPDARDSKIMKSDSGLSISTMSKILLLWTIEKGNADLHNSQSSFLNFTTTQPLCTFIVLFVSNHPFKHSICIACTDPIQLQGDINGLNLHLPSSSSSVYSSVPQHILHYKALEDSVIDLSCIAFFSKFMSFL